jgi:hypothetical protein
MLLFGKDGRALLMTWRNEKETRLPMTLSAMEGLATILRQKLKLLHNNFQTNQCLDYNLS